MSALLANFLEVHRLSQEALRQLATGESATVKAALDIIGERVASGISKSDEEDVKAALGEIAESNPSILTDIKMLAMGSVSGAGGRLLYEWLIPIINSVPK